MDISTLKSRLPNWLTYSRIVVIPLMVACFYVKGNLGFWLTSSLFMYAGITDFFDGYLARAWNAASNLGRFLDPIADKLLVSVALILLVSEGRAHVLPAIAILTREILVSGLREFLMEIQVSLPVSKLAKYKTAVQMLAIYLLLLSSAASPTAPIDAIGMGLLWIAAILTIITGYAYCRTGIKHMQ
jgi:cardiolipin synthase (CMP-forming)